MLTKCRQGAVEIVGSVTNSAVNVRTPFEDAKVYAVSDEYFIVQRLSSIIVELYCVTVSCTVWLSCVKQSLSSF